MAGAPNLLDYAHGPAEHAAAPEHHAPAAAPMAYAPQMHVSFPPVIAEKFVEVKLGLGKVATRLRQSNDNLPRRTLAAQGKQNGLANKRPILCGRCGCFCVQIHAALLTGDPYRIRLADSLFSQCFLAFLSALIAL